MADYQAWYTSDTFPSWQIPLNAGGAPDNLTGVTISNFTMIFRTLNNVDTTGTGTFTVMSTYPAVVLYKPSVADVAAAFTGNIIIKALYPPSNSTADLVVWDPIAFTITAV